MATNEEGDETAPRVNEWEVVSLTASAYAAAPGPEQVNLSPDSQGEASNPMFVSSHFVFPPIQHENLPVEPEYSVKSIPLLAAEEGRKSDVKDEENVSMEELMSDFDEEGNKLSASSVEFEKDDVFGKEKSISRFAEFQLSHFEATMDKFVTVAEGNVPLLQDNPSDSGSVNFEKPSEGENYDCSDLPCEAWWKRRAVTLYAQAKETNTFWSIFVAATVTGLVIISHRWHQERWQVLQLKGQSGVSDH